MALDLELRKGYLGGTDLAAISGLSDYTRPGDVWLEKMGQRTFTGNAATEMGQDLEPVVAMRHGRKFGVTLLELPPEPIYHPEYPFIAANPDRIYADRKRVLECKTASEEQLYGQESPWGEDGEPGRVPLGYLGQTNHYIGMTGFDDAYLSCLFLGRSRIQRDYPIPFDRDLYDLMIQNGVQFWRTYVEPRIQPPVELFSPEMAMKAVAMKARLEEKKAKAQESTPQVEAWAQHYRELSDQIDALTGKKKLLAAAIGGWIADQGGTKVKHSLGSFTFKQGDEKPASVVFDAEKAWAALVTSIPGMASIPGPVLADLQKLIDEVHAACTATVIPTPTTPTLRPYWAK